jgi:hypothetical protein
VNVKGCSSYLESHPIFRPLKSCFILTIWVYPESEWNGVQFHETGYQLRRFIGSYFDKAFDLMNKMKSRWGKLVWSPVFYFKKNLCAVFIWISHFAIETEAQLNCLTAKKKENAKAQKSKGLSFT